MKVLPGVSMRYTRETRDPRRATPSRLRTGRSRLWRALSLAFLNGT